jgi:hypothetical protein
MVGPWVTTPAPPTGPSTISSGLFGKPRGDSGDGPAILVHSDSQGKPLTGAGQGIPKTTHHRKGPRHQEEVKLRYT